MKTERRAHRDCMQSTGASAEEIDAADEETEGLHQAAQAREDR